MLLVVLPKVGSLGFLLNQAIAAKKYNTYTVPSGMKPVIIYLSMENTIQETISRIWCHCFGNDSNIANFDKIEAARMLEQAGIFTPNDPESPELLIWYRANRSINTADLEVLLEDLKKQGQYPVLLVLDYLKRIRATESNKDLRLELSNITDELKNLAISQDIPVLTAHQLKMLGHYISNSIMKSL